jgi:hypothetical protein
VKVPFASVERPRGQPLLVFAMVLGAWLVLRVLLWESPFSVLAPVRAAGESLTAREALTRRMAVVSAVPVTPAFHEGPSPARRPSLLPPTLPRPDRPELPPAYRSASTPSESAGQLQNRIGCDGMDRALPQTACRIGEPAVADAGFVQSAASSSADPFVAPRSQVSRWSGDAWLLVRKDSAAPLSVGRPVYGRSQAGAVLRYRLAPSSGHRPLLYTRATRALAGEREGEVAAGLAARPVPAVPVSVSAELRVHDSEAGLEVRPAVFAVTELPPVHLAAGFRAEAYAQAGYVGGTFATAFVDGQARVDRHLAHLGDGADLRAGAAVWGGAQKHAERLDVGPSVAASFRIGEANSRLALDYRFRVAGNAEPSSGPALTFSAGF